MNDEGRRMNDELARLRDGLLSRLMRGSQCEG
jgi:hypothetical protein